MADLKAKKHLLTRSAHYLFLLPFIPALQPLLVHFRMADMIIYLSGIVLVFILVMYGNQLPLLKTHDKGLDVHLHYRHNVDYHPYSQLESCKRLKGSRIGLYSKNHHSVVLKMRKKDIEKLIVLLEEKNIHELNHG